MTLDEIRAAADKADRRIRPHVIETPLRRSDYLSRAIGADVLCKLENVQITSSFKARGAANKLALLSDEQRRGGIVTASSGNHGAAVSAMLARFGGRGIVFVPAHTPRVKVEAIRGHGVEVRHHAGAAEDFETAAIAFAKANGHTYVSPYDDPDVIAGQATIGAELERQAGTVNHVFVAVGGGGLTAGIAGYLKASGRPVRIWGVSPVNDHSMALSARAGHAVPHLDASPTLSDGTAGAVQPGAITIPLCRDLVDDWPLVTESEIADAIRAYIENENQLIEGSAGVAIAGLLKAAQEQPGLFHGKTVVVIICGARIDAEKLVKVLSG
jgi:threonine dehydratase